MCPQQWNELCPVKLFPLDEKTKRTLLTVNVLYRQLYFCY